MCVYAHVHDTCVPGVCKVQKKVLRPLECSKLPWGAGNQTQGARVTNAINHRVISPSPSFIYLLLCVTYMPAYGDVYVCMQ